MTVVSEVGTFFMINLANYTSSGEGWVGGSLIGYWYLLLFVIVFVCLWLVGRVSCKSSTRHGRDDGRIGAGIC